MTADAFRTFHGSVVPEPFRWLEDATDPRVHAWAADQDRRTDEFLGGCDARARCREFLAASKVVAEFQAYRTSTPATAFDFTMLSPESFLFAGARLPGQ